MNLSYFRTDENLEVEGVWCPAPEGEARFKIARMSNSAWRRWLRKGKDRLRKALENWSEDQGSPPDEMLELYANTILLDWEGVTETGEDGEEVEYEYTKERAVEALSIKDFFVFVQNRATDMSRFRKIQNEEDRKN